jgi:endonuclease/exonuclease/phosphatase family metal-dependent hydrolase
MSDSRQIMGVFIALTMLVAGCSDEPETPVARDPEPVTVMTFNILCSFCDLSYDPWEDRLAYFDDIFDRHAPDLIGTQELAFPEEIEQILDLLPGYGVLFWGQDPAVETPWPDSAIFYREDRFSVVEQGVYWLSPTPEEPLSIGFSPPQLPRAVQWAQLLDAAGERDLFFATTHFDNNSPSQDLAAPLVIERTSTWAADMPVVFTGDFNSQTYDPAYAELTATWEDAYDLADEPGVIHNQDPEPSYDAPERIDHIFVDGADWAVSEWTVDLTTYGPEARYPSDHRAISATLSW